MCFKKKLWSIVLSAAMVLGTAIMPANMIFAASDNESQLQAMAVKSGTLQYGDSFKWTLDSKGTLKITGKGHLFLYSWDLERLKNKIKKIAIGSGVKEIDFSLSDNASLPKLAELSLPSTTKVLSGSLRGCANLSVVTGGKNVEDIQGRVFEGTKWCQSTEHVVLGKTYIAYNGTGKNVVVPEGTVAVSEAAFQSNKTLEAVTLPVSVKKIGSYAFKDCSSLKKIHGGSSVTLIDYDAFLRTPWLDSLNETTMLGKVLMKYKATAKDYTVSEKVTQIYEGAFSKCDNLESVTIKGKITEIPRRAFENCTSLKKITMPNTVTNIAYGAFDHCSALAKISLPSRLKKIETGAFIFCRSLQNVQVNGGKTNTKLQSIEDAAFAGCNNLKTLTIPWGVTTIGDYAYGYTDGGGDENSERDMVWKMMWGDEESVPKLNAANIIGISQSLGHYYAKENGIKFTATKKGSALKKPTVMINNSGELSILKVVGATGYEVYDKSPYDKHWCKAGTVKAPVRKYMTYKLKGYKYKVRAYRETSTGGYQYSAFSKIKTIK